jgi:nitroreductase
LISNRRTVHQFKPGEVPPIEKIEKAIDLARWAPNHHLTEPWHFYIIGPETVSAIIELNAELARNKNGDKAARIKLKRWSQIPGWLVLTCTKSEDPIRAQEDYAACCCAAQNMMLYLWHEGIGVKWTTGDVVKESRFYNLIRVDPHAEIVVGLFWYGYAEEIPNTKRKPIKQILARLP